MDVLHRRLLKSKVRRREGLKGLQSYIRPVVAGHSSYLLDRIREPGT